MSLPFKPFKEMTPADYAEIGLMCGLEVHQQLATGRKLFCRCPSRRYSPAFDAEVLRHMRPTLSELGEYDGTALMEKKTRKNIYYRIQHETVCTYEFDDTPPFFPDENAVNIAVEICMLTNQNLVSEMHIARKQYLDGSIPTGFQRTAIIGVTGWIPFKDRKIGIRQLSLEEDSCREVSDIGHDRVYLTDRLGMPLIEVVTEPDMTTPQETAEVCQLIRMICRSTGKVRTGYGAAREDVNVSVRGGTRVEIKGVPQITRIPLLIYNEAMRQCSLLAIRDVLKERGVTPETFKWERFDVTRTVGKTHFPPIRDSLAAGHRVKCVLLPGFGGVFNHTTQEHTTFAKEFSDRVRVIACLTDLPNIVHSDTATDLMSVRDWKELRKRTKAGDGDAMVLVWGSEADTETACKEIAIRAREATEGVPSDTRQAHKDGTNGFERVLPGPERMYPDTDLPPLEIAEARLKRIEDGLPERVWNRVSRYRELGVPADVIKPLCQPRKAALFDRLAGEVKINPVLSAVILGQRFKHFQREGLAPWSLDDEVIVEVFQAFAAGRFSREGLVPVFTHILEQQREDEAEEPGPPERVNHAITALGLTPVPAKSLESEVRQTLLSLNSQPMRKPHLKQRYLMGKLMADLRGKGSGTRIAEWVAKA